MGEDVRSLSELARELIAACAHHLDSDDALDDPAVAAIHAEVAALEHPDQFMQMLAAWVLVGERKAADRLPEEVFRDRDDLRAGYLLDNDGARLMVFKMFNTLDLLADPHRSAEALREHLRILTEAYGEVATVSLVFVYLSWVRDVADFEGVQLGDVLRTWFLDEARSIEG